MTRGNGYVKGLFIGSLFGGLIGAFAVSFYPSKSGMALRKDIKNKASEYHDETTKIITDAKIRATDMMNEGKEINKEVKSKTDSVVSNVKEDNSLQINIMEKAGIPKKEILKYALSSIADGRILRDYINEVKNGEISLEGAIKKVKQDYEKMKSGEKEGKFVTPSNT
jgi:gas vesicle protein